MSHETSEHIASEDVLLQDQHTTDQVEVQHEIVDHETEEHSEHISHEVTLSAEPIFDIGGFSVTNSLLNTWLAMAIIIVFAIVLKTKLKQIPKGIQNLFEIVIEGALSLCDSVTGDRKISQKVFPMVFTFFIFVLVNNWLGLIPGIGSIGFIEGGETFVPYFRGGTADLNTTLALALISVIGANVFGVIAVGGWNYFNKFVNVKAILEIPKKILKDPAIIFVNIIKFFVGIIEIVGEVAKVASLSFRLFGNVFAGEVLISSIAVIFAFVLPIPFMFLEVIVGVIQALIFGMLTLVYYTIAASADEH